jgi:hypothetical protein
MIVIYKLNVTNMSHFTAKPYENQSELYNALTSRTENVMENVLAGIAFNDSNPLSGDIQVRESAINM